MFVCTYIETCIATHTYPWRYNHNLFTYTHLCTHKHTDTYKVTAKDRHTKKFTRQTKPQTNKHVSEIRRKRVKGGGLVRVRVDVHIHITYIYVYYKIVWVQKSVCVCANVCKKVIVKPRVRVVAHVIPYSFTTVTLCVIHMHLRYTNI